MTRVDDISKRKEEKKIEEDRTRKWQRQGSNSFSQEIIFDKNFERFALKNNKESQVYTDAYS